MPTHDLHIVGANSIHPMINVGTSAVADALQNTVGCPVSYDNLKIAQQGANLAAAPQVVFANKQFKLQLPVNAKPGLYFIQIKDSGNHIYNLKFVVE